MDCFGKDDTSNGKCLELWSVVGSQEVGGTSLKLDRSAGVAFYIASNNNSTIRRISNLLQPLSIHAYSASTSFFTYSALSIPFLISFSSRRLA